MFSKMEVEKALYIVVDVGNPVYFYALYRIEMDANSLRYCSSTDQHFSLLNEPVLVLGSEFPSGLAFFSFGSRIYMLGSHSRMALSHSRMALSRSVFIYDTVAGELGVANQTTRIPKCIPIIIQPLKPFDDRVFVLSQDLCGHDLEVFFPGDHDSDWTFIGAPSCFVLPPYSRVKSHAIVLDGFLLLISTNVVFYYNIHKNNWSIVTMESSSFLFLLQPHVFAPDMSMWFYFCDNAAFLHGFNERFKIGELPLLHLNPPPASCRFHGRNHFLYLGDNIFCVVRSGYDRSHDSRTSCSDPFACHHATVTLYRLNPSANAILEQCSSSYQIMKVHNYDFCGANVCACFAI